MEMQRSLVERQFAGEGEGKQTQDGGAPPSPSSSEAGHKTDRRLHLGILQIPARCEDVIEPTSYSSLLPPLSAAKSGKISTPHGLLPRSGLRSRASLDRNMHMLATSPGSSQRGAPGSSLPSSSGSAPISLNVLPAMRTSSLPVRANAINLATSPVSNQGHGEVVDIDLQSEVEPPSQLHHSVDCMLEGSNLPLHVPGHEKVGIVRSFSTPVQIDKLGSLRRVGSGSKGFVLLRSVSPRAVAPQTPQGTAIPDATTIQQVALGSNQSDTEKENGSSMEESDEAIPEEEAVCRICMDGLTEEYGETLKMECSCRGEMALAHKECAFKWFGIKGNRMCDVCGHEVTNIPVTVIRLPDIINVTRPVETQNLDRGTVWQDIPVLGMISMLAYFCFLQQLLVEKMETGALAIALPFSIILGCLASITTVALVSRRYIWLYAFIQFGLVVTFTYVFYSLTALDAVLSVLLAAFAGFGLAMTTNAIILEYIHWKRCVANRRSQANMLTMQEHRRQELNRELAPLPLNLLVDSELNRELAPLPLNLLVDSEPAIIRVPHIPMSPSSTPLLTTTNSRDYSAP